jgi:hypothetical protein
LLRLERRREKVDLVSKEQSDAPVIRTERPGPYPYDFTSSTERVEISGAVTTNSKRQNI